MGESQLRTGQTTEPSGGRFGPGQRPRPGRGWVVLVAGGLSTVALIWAAAVVLGDAEAAGPVAAARLSGQVSDAVSEELQRWGRNWQPREGDFTAEEHLVAAAAQSALVLGRELAEPAELAWEWNDGVDDVLNACDMLLREATRVQRGEGGETEALALVEDALAVADDLRREGEARLRGVQLAVRLHRVDLVAEMWQSAWASLDGRATRNGTSSLLLCALSAAPLLGLEERHRAWQLLSSRWLAGELHWAGEATSLQLVDDRLFLREGAMRRRWRERLIDLALPTGLGSQDVAAFVSRDREHWRDAAARALLPIERPFVPAGELQLFAVSGGWFAWRGSAAGSGQGWLLSADRLRRLWQDDLRRSGVLPVGFAVSLAGGAAASGTAVRPAQSLSLGGPDVALQHSDYHGLVTSLARDRTVSGFGLLVAALFSAIAALATWRALRRQARLDQLKSAFVASVSHELRTPVASILLMSENLEEGRVTDESGRERYYGLMRRESLRLGRLVNDVLDFSRLERGEPARLCREPVDVALFLDDLLVQLSEHVQRRDGMLVVARAELHGVVEADQDALCRAALNLVENGLVHGARVLVTNDGATEGTGAGQPDVAVTIAATDGALKISVRDYGRGLPAARRREVFKPFERGEQSTAGMGLGLSIVAAIVEGHGGFVTVGSPEGGPGVVFAMTLPAEFTESSNHGQGD
ncbi:MAG: signal transduction histidine kinase [Pseudohongiellaceae bacterium]|jgi:signal transduction histidine kinase